MTLYTLEVCENLIRKYYENDGYCITIEDGSLGIGTVLCFGEGLKTTVIHEKFLNEWSSAHSIRKYNKAPQKYQKIIDDFYNNEESYNEVNLGFI